MYFSNSTRTYKVVKSMPMFDGRVHRQKQSVHTPSTLQHSSLFISVWKKEPVSISRKSRYNPRGFYCFVVAWTGPNTTRDGTTELPKSHPPPSNTVRVKSTRNRNQRQGNESSCDCRNRNAIIKARDVTTTSGVLVANRVPRIPLAVAPLFGACARWAWPNDVQAEMCPKLSRACMGAPR
jgi:hypothetical protein